MCLVACLEPMAALGVVQADIHAHVDACRCHVMDFGMSVKAPGD
jgi:hypothetical protein